MGEFSQNSKMRGLSFKEGGYKDPFILESGSIHATWSYLPVELIIVGFFHFIKVCLK
uniref:Uncharacterized protein n=1 Tax=Anguilla anguilla TaxID=7936 RepID=A0A0E9VS50_ANGAN